MELDRAVRAFDPIPGAFTLYDGQPVKIWTAEPGPREAAAAPGTVIAVSPAGVDIACSEGSLRVKTLQPAGGKRMSAAAFAAGRALAIGARFGPADPA